MILIAAILYLPEHVSTIAGRVAYYWHGHAALTDTLRSSEDLVSTVLHTAVMVGAPAGASMAGVATGRADRTALSVARGQSTVAAAPPVVGGVREGDGLEL